MALNPSGCEQRHCAASKQFKSAHDTTIVAHQRIAATGTKANHCPVNMSLSFDKLFPSHDGVERSQ
ncbi:hypothetical protein GCM10010520_14770 [Rhizobium viscosum]